MTTPIQLSEVWVAVATSDVGVEVLSTVKPKKEKSARNRSVSRSADKDSLGEAGSTMTAVSGRTSTSCTSAAASPTSSGSRRTLTAISDAVTAPPRKVRREKPRGGAAVTAGSRPGPGQTTDFHAHLYARCRSSPSSAVHRSWFPLPAICRIFDTISSTIRRLLGCRLAILLPLSVIIVARVFRLDSFSWAAYTRRCAVKRGQSRKFRGSCKHCENLACQVATTKSGNNDLGAGRRGRRRTVDHGVGGVAAGQRHPW